MNKSKSDLPDNKQLGKLTVDQRIELGKSFVGEGQAIMALEAKIGIYLIDRKDLTHEEKCKLGKSMFQRGEIEIKEKYRKERDTQRLVIGRAR